jgi:hypothetical protein
VNGFATEDAGVVDEGVHATEAVDRLRHDAFRGVRLGDVSGNSQEFRIRWLSD